MTGRFKLLSAVLFLVTGYLQLSGQDVLTMQEALELGVKNYGTIKSKDFLVQSSQQGLSQIKRDYLPNVVLSGQQVYGTVNGQNGPLYGFGFGVASSGLPLPEQNWNAGFGALYLANVNWEVFAFGRARGRNHVAEAALDVAQSDFAQEQFQHQVRVAAAYLNVLGTQRLAAAQQKNLVRAQVVQRSVTARVKGGLVAGVDSSLANAEVANAKIALLRAVDLQQEEEKKLALLMGIDGAGASLDSSFVFETPVTSKTDSVVVSAAHPVLSFYQSRVDQSLAQVKLSRKSYFPSLNLVGVLQTRASGFSFGYNVDQTAFTSNYSDGVSPSRSNYLVGVGLVWNLTSMVRASAQVKSMNYSSMASQAEFELAKQQLNTQAQIADTRLSNALQIQQEAPIQVTSATDAYTQKGALYRNGLTTLVDVTQTLYTLNRAETDRDLAFINVWQALLMKAAATGDLTLFTNELNRQ